MYIFFIYLHRKRTCSITDSAPDYGSGGWGFESLQVRKATYRVAFFIVLSLFFFIKFGISLKLILMTNFFKSIHRSHYVNSDFIKRICFLNNVKSKFLTIALIISSLIFSFYDVSVLQKTSDSHIFLLHLKADIIFLVFSFIFALYIYFNQVKTHHTIQKHHKFIHVIISLFILLLSTFKSVIFIKYSAGNYNLAIICILATSLIYQFPFRVFFGQIALNLFFALVLSLLLHFTISEIVKTIYILVIISFISLLISQSILYLQHKILLKEKEILRYRKRLIL